MKVSTINRITINKNINNFKGNLNNTDKVKEEREKIETLSDFGLYSLIGGACLLAPEAFGFATELPKKFKTTAIGFALLIGAIIAQSTSFIKEMNLNKAEKK